ncbi:MAG: hypothetical protein LBR23_07065 [Spirochaetaceae bacterium]|jgi:hypothetical protein|nr:hypothetical protein [Spirochaetaceae bacterium]
MKKFLAFLVFLALCGGCVFYFGWIQFTVPIGKYGVMLTKTSGVYPQTLRRGVFAWSAERLIPTNTEILLFDAQPYTAVQTLSGELPSAKVYSSVLEQKPDFSYSVSLHVTLNVRPESLPSLCDRMGVTTQEALTAFLDQKSKEAAHIALDALLAQKKLDHTLLASLSAEPTLQEVEVLALGVESARIPDIALYTMARESYGAYRAEVDAAMARRAPQDAQIAVKNAAAMEQLEKLGEIFERHPALLEIFSRNASPAETIRQVSSLVDAAASE